VERAGGEATTGKEGLLDQVVKDYD